MSYTLTKRTPNITEYNGYKYELPQNEYKWVSDPSWYDTKATTAERNLINQYVQLIYDAVKYIQTKDMRIRVMLKMIPESEMPTPEFRQHIVERFYKTLNNLT